MILLPRSIRRIGSSATTALQSTRKWLPSLFTLTVKPCIGFAGWTEFEDSAEALFKLRQIGTLKDYISEFWHLANCTTDLGPILLKSCFLGGLKRELKYDVKLLRPLNVHDAIAIAVQLDTKFTNLQSGCTKPNPIFRSPTPAVATSIVTPRNPNFPVKRLAPEEIQRKRERGDCWSVMISGVEAISVLISNCSCLIYSVLRKLGK